MAWHHQDCWSQHGRCSACHTPKRSWQVCGLFGCEHPLQSALREPVHVRTAAGPLNLQHVCVLHATETLRERLRQARSLLTTGLIWLVVGGVLCALIPLCRTDAALHGSLMRNMLPLGVVWLLGGLLALGASLRRRVDYTFYLERLYDDVPPPESPASDHQPLPSPDVKATS
jgi:hypothetical protein